MRKGRPRSVAKIAGIIALAALLLCLTSPVAGVIRGISPMAEIGDEIYIEAYAAADESGALIIDPESISGNDSKEGNMLLEYEYAVFTNESMAEMQAAKEREEKARQEIVDGLFSGEWNEIANYDAEVTEIIKAGDLFSYIGTVTESKDAAYADGAKILKHLPVILTIILTAAISGICIGVIRKRNEYKHNNRAG